jgi:hypothetical protein
MEIDCLGAKVCHKLEGTLKVNIRVVNYLFFSILTFLMGKEEEETYDNSVLLTWGGGTQTTTGSMTCKNTMLFLCMCLLGMNFIPSEAIH